MVALETLTSWSSDVGTQIIVGIIAIAESFAVTTVRCSQFVPARIQSNQLTTDGFPKIVNQLYFNLTLTIREPSGARALDSSFKQCLILGLRQSTRAGTNGCRARSENCRGAQPLPEQSPPGRDSAPFARNTLKSACRFAASKTRS